MARLSHNWQAVPLCRSSNYVITVNDHVVFLATSRPSDTLLPPAILVNFTYAPWVLNGHRSVNMRQLRNPPSLRAFLTIYHFMPGLHCIEIQPLTSYALTRCYRSARPCVSTAPYEYGTVETMNIRNRVLQQVKKAFPFFYPHPQWTLRWLHVPTLTIPRVPPSYESR